MDAVLDLDAKAQRRNWHCVELIITRSIIVRAAFNLLHKKWW